MFQVKLDQPPRGVKGLNGLRGVNGFRGVNGLRLFYIDVSVKFHKVVDVDLLYYLPMIEFYF